MNNSKLILAHAAAALSPCVLCRKLNPPERLSPGRLCVECWTREGAPVGWVLVPEGMALVPLQAVRQANLCTALAGELQAHQGERGVEEPILLTLRRLLEERKQLMEDWPTVRCCYCGQAGTRDDIATGVLDGMDTTEKLPGLRYCSDRAACLARIEAQVQARQATAAQKAN